ncbi:hypothetical protein [Pseudomonas viridiflava]|uniref:hypothetical protein n=1 Tax=Pseudomonas viridiflava TaxID=33069 RepID=UPI000F03C0A0|nr:hypothetical protein [Pseudomonas viridiflava]
MQQIAVPAFNPRPYIESYYAALEVDKDNNPFPRLKAWEILYEYIWGKSHSWSKLTDSANLDTTALHVGFYLANWGMFRGRSELLRNSNLDLMKELVLRLFQGKGAELFDLSGEDFLPGAPNLARNQALLDEVIQIFHNMPGNVSWTDTLISKILLGVWGEYPALDRYYKLGIRSFYPYRGLTEVSGYSLTLLMELIEMEGFELPAIETKCLRLSYPQGRLLDMAFFQAGLGLTTLTTS